MIVDLTSLSGANIAPALLLGGVAAAFVVGGVVKGTLGVGLPLVVAPALSLAMPSPQAISLLVVPVLASNLWQAYDSRVSVHSVRRFTPLLVALVLTTLLTVPLTLAMPPRMLNAMLAAAVIAAVVLMALRPQFDISARHEKISGFMVGALSGAMGGISSLTGPIIISYLMALKLTREDFVGNISVIYLCGAIPLYAAMAAYGRLGVTELALSIAALIPLSCGLAIGKCLRGRLSELWFRRVLLTLLSVIAAALLLKSQSPFGAMPGVNLLPWNHDV